jgi:hypothetical protein
VDEHAKVSRVGDLVSYQEGAVVSRIILKRETGNVTLFAFDAGQELSEHTAPYDALAQVVPGTRARLGGSPGHPTASGCELDHRGHAVRRGIDAGGGAEAALQEGA